MSYDGYSIGEFGKLEKMVRDMKTPLYPGCKEKWTKLFTSLKLLQLKATHHWTDRDFKTLLDLLRDMLPEGNEIPKTTYEVKQAICTLGMEVEKIKICKNNCIQFRGDHAGLTECSECGAPRYERRNDGWLFLKKAMTDMIVVSCWHVGLLEISFGILLLFDQIVRGLHQFELLLYLFWL